MKSRRDILDKVLPMYIKLVARTVTAAIFGALFGLYMYHDHLKWIGLGRAAFLDWEGMRFDRVIVHPKPEIVAVLSVVIAALIVAGLYELVVAGISKFFSSAS
ncbi:MAG TPA: hypothetical protein VK578_23740 [Edaphobacter sp.]|nr:hypothetical protein [Edaphobacter sp.]